MKKTRKSSSLIMAAMAILSFSACEDWGQMDPPAGTDVYPKLEQVGNIDFEAPKKEGEAGFDPTSFNYYAYEGGDIAVVEQDEVHGQVLHLPNGYARTLNPLAKYKAQDGVSLTFWVKTSTPHRQRNGERNGTGLEWRTILFSEQQRNPAHVSHRQWMAEI
ncbi:hypothetical protein [Bacteroides zoogleoformans]|uniref:hypothetical protein n=1 Tax=Bacteroides zoogleoformans TaxID=28119 RepID=UPI00248F03CA|nr:hypothetical protein [Bacteroides zoogleoformans]